MLFGFNEPEVFTSHWMVLHTELQQRRQAAATHSCVQQKLLSVMLVLVFGFFWWPIRSVER